MAGKKEQFVAGDVVDMLIGKKAEAPKEPKAERMTKNKETKTAAPRKAGRPRKYDDEGVRLTIQVRVGEETLKAIQLRLLKDHTLKTKADVVNVALKKELAIEYKQLKNLGDIL
jgi:hypothetical protein